VTAPATLVLVHGAWHGAWCWDRIVPRLEAAGIPTIAFDLPGHGASREPLGDLADDAAALRAVLDGIDGPAVVCGHSYGGAVVAEGAAGHPAVAHLVFLTAFPLDVGESCMNAAAGMLPEGAGATKLGSALQLHEDDTITVDPEAASAALYNECSADDAAWAAGQLGSQTKAELAGVATRAAWRETPSTYVVCTRDEAVAVALQRALAARCSRVVELDADHSPFLSRTDEVVELLTRAAVDAGG
jgi:pimeloyl-ACP methyl ester carboxylesterase